jgi:hypothetical protein
MNTENGLQNECLEDALSLGASIINQGGGSVYRSLMRPAIVYPVNKQTIITMCIWDISIPTGLSNYNFY